MELRYRRREIANFTDARAITASPALGQGDILDHLADAYLDDELVVALRGAIRLKETRTAVSQL